MPANSNLPSKDRIRTRSIARVEDKAIEEIATELATALEVQAPTRPRTRSVANLENPVKAAPEPAHATRGRTGSKAAAPQGTKQTISAKAVTTAVKDGKKKRGTGAKSRARGARTRTLPQQMPEVPVPTFSYEPREVNRDHRRTVKQELGGDVVASDEAYVKDMYAHLATDNEIKRVFKKLGYAPRKKYGGGVGRWSELPEVAASDGELYGKFVKITNAVLKHLGEPKAQRTRTAEDTHSKQFIHADNKKHHSSPCIGVIATGPSFESPDGKAKACYSNMASCFEVNTESSQEGDGELVEQTGIYARQETSQKTSLILQIFIYQPNRKFVRTIALTENHVRLIHFDRSGAKYSPSIDIHKDPYTFVRLILGLTSSDEELLGLDTNVQWTIDENGEKVAGTIVMVNLCDEEITFDLLDVEPVFQRAAVCGRGTTCWSGRSREVGADGKRTKVCIKDAWRSNGRAPEYISLEGVRGVNGVIRIFHYEDFLGETKEYRGSCASDQAHFTNRICLRVVTEQLGKPLDHFTSQKQAISALRDVILTHRNMITVKQILHRDISMQNILIGLVPEDAFPGLRGVLIDLDMAIPSDPRGMSNVPCDYQTGARPYQSCSVLCSYPYDIDYEADAVLPHTYLDDLESFFFVTAHLMFGWAGVGKETFPEIYELWGHENPTVSQHAKWAFIKEELDVKSIPTFWEMPCLELLGSFQRFIYEVGIQKRKIMGIDDLEERSQEMEELHAGFEDHYKRLKTMFDKALRELDELEAKRPAPPFPVPRLAPAAVPDLCKILMAPRVPTRKRGLGSFDESDEPESPCKRTRVAVGMKSPFAKVVDA